MNNSHIQWAIGVLNSKNFKLFSIIPEVIQETPWSQVYRFNTNQGYIFLKKVPEKLAIEAQIIDILYKKFHAPVPHIISKYTKIHLVKCATKNQQAIFMARPGVTYNDVAKAAIELTGLGKCHLPKISSADVP